MHPNDVVKVVREFVQKRPRESDRAPMLNSPTAKDQPRDKDRESQGLGMEKAERKRMMGKSSFGFASPRLVSEEKKRGGILETIG